MALDDWLIEQMEGSTQAFAAGEVAEVTDVVARLTGTPSPSSPRRSPT